MWKSNKLCVTESSRTYFKWITEFKVIDSFPISTILGSRVEHVNYFYPQSTWEIEVAWKPGDESTSPEFLRFGLGQWEQEQITHRDFIRHGAPVLMQHNSLFRGDTVHILEQKKCKKVSSNEDLLPQNPESFAHRATWRTLAACLSFPSLSCFLRAPSLQSH